MTTIKTFKKWLLKVMVPYIEGAKQSKTQPTSPSLYSENYSDLNEDTDYS